MNRSPRVAPRGAGLTVVFVATFVLGLLLAGSAEAQIKTPGAHPRYSLELDPHLTLQHDRGPFNDEGVGLGLRATIPLFHNGPVPQINNNMGISFGADYVFFGDDDDCRFLGRRNDFIDRECGGSDLWIPVTVQWNFWFTPVISVFGEPGLALQYTSAYWEYDCGGGAICEADDDDLDVVEFVMFVGGRFMFSNNVGMTVRLGSPYVSVGATFLM
jgi:hypothetical protein